MNGIGAKNGAKPKDRVSRLGDVLSPIQSNDSAAFGVADRLERKFGVGTNPAARRALYSMCEAAVRQFGDTALGAISETVALAVNARKDPGRYFAHTIKVKLAERGMGPRSGGDPSW